METKVTVTGHRDAMRALNRLDKTVARDLKKWLKEAAQPVATDAAARLSRFRGASTGTIKPAATLKGVFVRQNARTVTGKRPDFGGLIMTEALIPAAWSLIDQTEDLIGDAWDRVAQLEGF